MYYKYVKCTYSILFYRLQCHGEVSTKGYKFVKQYNTTKLSEYFNNIPVSWHKGIVTMDSDGKSNKKMLKRLLIELLSMRL